MSVPNSILDQAIVPANWQLKFDVYITTYVMQIRWNTDEKKLVHLFLLI